MYTVAIIAAAGQGRRLGTPVPKQFLEIGGRSILQRSLDPFVASAEIDEIFAVLPLDLVEAPPPLVSAKPLHIVPGGPRRQDSVANAFGRLPADAELVVVHDAARPFVTVELLEATLLAAAEAGAAVAALPAQETVKQAESIAGEWLVSRTLPREAIFLAQTPQAFLRDVLQDALALGRRGTDATDEAMLAERAGHAVRIVPGDRRNIKITTEEDLIVAEALLEGNARTGEVRSGTGYDLHRLVEGRPLVLGGVAVPFEKGLAGHSDADVLCHAITDAILGAAGAGDIGRHFSDADERWRGAASLDLLERAAKLVREKGFRVENVDAVLVAERPRIGPFVDQMRQAVGAAIGIGADRVSIKGKSNEGVGEIGRGEAMAAHAVALVRRVEAV